MMKIFQLDVTKDHCPMTFVKTKLELEKLGEGDRLDVLVNEGEPLENIPASAKEQGFTVTDIRHVQGAVYKITIAKGDGKG
ncbi:MAG: sulfurtransferase TusA family protein [Syntrophorhabdales bacterium]|jgi:TusA-related sulfurtransferase